MYQRPDMSGLDVRRPSRGGYPDESHGRTLQKGPADDQEIQERQSSRTAGKMIPDDSMGASIKGRSIGIPGWFGMNGWHRYG